MRRRREHVDSSPEDDDDSPVHKRTCQFHIHTSTSTDLAPLLSSPLIQTHHSRIQHLIHLFATFTGIDESISCDETSQRMSREMLYGHRLNEFWEAVGIDSQDVMTLVLAWKWKCTTTGVIYRIEFIRGMMEMECTSIHELSQKLAEMRRILEQTPTGGKRGDIFKELYLWVFQFHKQQQLQNRRTIDVTLAIQLLRILLADRFPQHVASFAQYLQRHVIQTTPGFRMTQDQWSSYYEFCHIVQPHTLIAYDPEGSWPVLIDEYVEWLQSHQRAPTSTPSTTPPKSASAPLKQTNFYAEPKLSISTSTSTCTSTSSPSSPSNDTDIDIDPGGTTRPRRTRSTLQHVRIECDDEQDEDGINEIRDMGVLIDGMGGYHMHGDGDGDVKLDGYEEKKQVQTPPSQHHTTNTSWKLTPPPIVTSACKQYTSLSPTPSPQSLSSTPTPRHLMSSQDAFPSTPSTSTFPFAPITTSSPTCTAITNSLTHLLRIASTSSTSTSTSSSHTTSLLPFPSPIPSTVSFQRFQPSTSTSTSTSLFSTSTDTITTTAMDDV